MRRNLRNDPLAPLYWKDFRLDHQWPDRLSWTTWLLLGGRGAGKTRAGAEWTRHVAERFKPKFGNGAGAIALVAESYADAREIMIEGPSGLRAIADETNRPVYEVSRRRLVWKNGAEARIFSAEDPDGIRGYQFDAAWCDDPKSAESALPHYSTGARDDLAQRRAVEAGLSYWRDPANNPVSSVYGGTMIEAERSHIYAYDARPYPFFPALSAVWGDAANWEKGHWLNGRLTRAPLDLLVTALANYAGAAGAASAASVDAGALKGVITGYVVDRPVSGREAIDPLADLYQFDMVETASGLRFQPRDAEPDFVLAADDLAAREDAALSVSFSQGSDLPAAFRLGFLDENADYAPAIADARSPNADHVRETALEAPVVTNAAEAEARARAILADAHLMRETARFSLPPSMLGAEPGDVIYLDEGGVPRRWRITEIVDAGERRVEAARAEPSVYGAPVGAASFRAPTVNSVHGAPLWELLDLPLVANEEPGAALLAAYSDPWPGAVALYREGAGGAVFAGLARARATIGRLEAGLPPGAAGRWDKRGLRLRLSFGSLSSKSEDEVFAGANALAVETAAGFEVVQFQGAVLGADGAWTLSPLLRGQAGTEDRAALGAASGARAVLLDPALAEVLWPLDLRGQAMAFQAGPERDLPDTESFSAKTLTLTARSLLPLSPVYLKAAPEAGALRLSWIRRTRTGGDSWEGEVPLGEAYERYRVSVYDGASLLRSLDVSPPFDPGTEERPNWLYLGADIAADFGPGGLAAASDPHFTVAQLSDRVGPGVAARAGL